MNINIICISLQWNAMEREMLMQKLFAFDVDICAVNCMDSDVNTMVIYFLSITVLSWILNKRINSLNNNAISVDWCEIERELESESEWETENEREGEKKNE